AHLGAVPRVGSPGVAAPLVALATYASFACTLLAGPHLSGLEAAGHRRRGDELLRAGDPAGAVAAYTEALRVAPDDRYALGNRGIAHAARGEFAAYVAAFDRAIGLGPHDTVL